MQNLWLLFCCGFHSKSLGFDNCIFLFCLVQVDNRNSSAAKRARTDGRFFLFLIFFFFLMWLLNYSCFVLMLVLMMLNVHLQCTTFSRNLIWVLCIKRIMIRACIFSTGWICEYFCQMWFNGPIMFFDISQVLGKAQVESWKFEWHGLLLRC